MSECLLEGLQGKSEKVKSNNVELGGWGLMNMKLMNEQFQFPIIHFTLN